MSHKTLMMVTQLAVLLLDVVVIVLSMLLAQHVRVWFPVLGDDNLLNPTLAVVRPTLLLGWITLIALFGGYSVREFGAGTESYRRVFNATVFAGGVFAVGLFFFRVPMSRAYVLVLFTVSAVLLLLGRYIARRILHRLYRRGLGRRRVLVVGRGAGALELITRLREYSALGLTPVAIAGTTPQEAAYFNLPLVEASDGLVPLAEAVSADLILFTDGSVPRTTDFRRHLWQFEGHDTELAVVSSFVDLAADRVRTRPLAGTKIVYVEAPRSAGALSRSKRCFDVLLTLVLIVLVSPLMLLTALFVRADGGPALFRQTRVGRNGTPFTMFKFRSMVIGAEKQRPALDGGHETNAVMFKLHHDPRVTRVGRFIRRFSIDELPQLFNVLRGEMSLIGPRPPLPEEVAQYTDDEYRRLRVRPGLTGLWQVSGRSDLSWEETVRLDLYYIDNWSALQDFSIMLRTVSAVLSSRGSY